MISLSIDGLHGFGDGKLLIGQYRCASSAFALDR